MALAVIAYASAGDFAWFNPHLRAIFLGGGFDREGQFLHVPSLDLAKLGQYFRSSMVAFFLKHSLLNERLARNMLGWTHSGFGVDEEDARRRARGERFLPVRI